jgi:hypothetical protein
MNPPGVVHLCPTRRAKSNCGASLVAGWIARAADSRTARPARTEPSRIRTLRSDWALDILCRYRRWQPDLQCGQT